MRQLHDNEILSVSGGSNWGFLGDIFNSIRDFVTRIAVSIIVGKAPLLPAPGLENAQK